MDGIHYHPNLKSKENKDNHPKKKEVTKEEAPSQPTSPRREEEQEKELEKTIFPNLQVPKFQKDSMDNVVNMAKALMEFKNKEEQRMRQPHFPMK
ncbi:hypothetical protein O181_093832 [Austropuccinia psidii MF-1]|uniref:Uncharacterized protein n=1 Tax=Austropuccinia psidii MF-1 TaxID=1389203 RepID=A0A9Q3J285_9BASI|nr:hypothetical protein [Austropuccinia psidii MF-1]